MIFPSVFDTDNSFVEVFRAGVSGRLTLLSETARNLPIGVSGPAAH